MSARPKTRSRKVKPKASHNKSVPITECTCEASCSGLSGPSQSSTCELHKYVPESELEIYEHMEKLRDQEFQKMTDAHEKRMKYFRKELIEYLQETAWQYKPIEHFIKF